MSWEILRFALNDRCCFPFVIQRAKPEGSPMLHVSLLSVATVVQESWEILRFALNDRCCFPFVIQRAKPEGSPMLHVSLLSVATVVQESWEILRFALNDVMLFSLRHPEGEARRISNVAR